MSLLLSRVSASPQVRLAPPLSPPPSMRGSLFGAAVMTPAPRGRPALHAGLHWAVPRAAQAPAPEPGPQRHVFDGVDRALRGVQVQRSGAPEADVSWAARMRNALTRYRAAEVKLAAAHAMSPRDRERRDIRFEPLRRQVRTALQVVRNMCDPANGRVPASMVAYLTPDALWEGFQQAIARRSRELVRPLRWDRPAPPPRLYKNGVFGHLARRLRPLMRAEKLDPKLKAWAYWVRQTLVEEYVLLEAKCRELEAERRHATWDKREKLRDNRLPLWREDAMQTLQAALAQPRDEHGAWRPGFEALARAPRLCALLATCQAALALRTRELAPAWAADIS